MISIHFEEKSDCQQLFQQLSSYMKRYAKFGLKGHVQAEGSEMILVNYENEHVNFYDSFQPFLASVLTEYVIATKEEEWLLDIIETMFYFTDEEEQQQILTIARAILEGDRKDLPSLSPFFNRRAFVYEAFSKHIEEEMTFYYEPFITFRLREYGEMLIDCVEIAIDEYMMEQEYQNMVEDFRQYIRLKKPKRDKLILVHDGTFTFYDEHACKISKEEILFHLQEDLVFEQGVAIEEMVISPLVCMLPETVKVFSNNNEHGVILTIQTIFQERMELYPLEKFKLN
ncbi:putative sporulation protein YtxC [Halalkalibacterium ligniniphilum]|uniref:putative sporulation protein YtxC n=1 Tax=Halalkalibacterium ligniniphilum TaxID=1134413 RepID=UPI000347AC9E|nr:putative sporulation protein YtxC [Halalkalibacterium ligniniphilum]